MTITKNDARQETQLAFVDFGFADFADNSAAELEAIKLPTGAVVVGGSLVITEVFNSGTSDVIDVGDSTDDDRYTGTPVDVTALGLTAVTPTGFSYGAGDDVTLMWTGVGAIPTTGAGRLTVEYYAETRSKWTQD